MKPRSAVLLLLFALVVAFAALNWRVFTAPAALDVLVARFEAPLGVVMLFMIGVIAVVFLLMLARAEIAALLETRRIMKEMERIRQLADSAEASRVEELRQLVIAETANIRGDIELLRRAQERLPAPAAEPPAP